MAAKKSIMDRLGPFPVEKGWMVKEWVSNLKFWTDQDGFEDLRVNIFTSSLDKRQHIDWWRGLPDASKDTWDHMEVAIFERFVPTDDYQQELRTMWRSSDLKQQIGESVQAYAEKILRITSEMVNPPDENEKIFQFRIGLIPSIRKRLTLGDFNTMADWVHTAVLAEKDLLLDCKGTTELTNGLLNDNISGKHLISYHEGLKDQSPSVGVLALNEKEKQVVNNEDVLKQKEDLIVALNAKIKQLESNKQRNVGKNQNVKGNPTNKGKSQSFPYPNRGEENQSEDKGSSIKRFRNDREKQNRQEASGNLYCNRCRKRNHNTNDC
jgi:hypothetical protein